MKSVENKVVQDLRKEILDSACAKFREERNKVDDLARAKKYNVRVDIKDLSQIKKEIQKEISEYRLVLEDQGDQVLRNTNFEDKKEFGYIRNVDKNIVEIICYNQRVYDIALKYKHPHLKDDL